MQRLPSAAGSLTGAAAISTGQSSSRLLEVRPAEEDAMSYEQIELARDCPAVQIPDGNAVTIPAGYGRRSSPSRSAAATRCRCPSLGGLFRVAGQDADALGLEAPEAGRRRRAAEQGPVTEDPGLGPV